MPDQGKQESGLTLMVIGWLLVLAALMALFFQPSYTGRKWLAAGAAVLALGGLAMNVIGYSMRKKAR
jgi:ABC-type Co2+ transport system permease subunit